MHEYEYTSVPEYDDSSFSDGARRVKVSCHSIDGKAYLLLLFHHFIGNNGDLEATPVITSFNDDRRSTDEVKVLSLCEKKK